MAPVVATFPLQAVFTAAATPTNADLGTVVVSENTAATLDTAAPITSVSELTPASSFGGDIVTIAAGPGGVFGNVVYAISRGAGDNAAIGAVDRPGVIYRVNTATGKSSVFFDLNTVLNQIDPNNSTPGMPAANSLGNSTGLVNWYSITFDSEGLFSGTPAMFVSSVDRSDPNKNIIFEIAPNGTLMGVFVQMTYGLSSLKFNISPTAILIPPVQDQSFLSGLIAGSGISTTSGTFAALYFQSTSYSPGQVISNATLPTGVTETNLGLPVDASVVTTHGTTTTATVNTGPIVGLTASNSDYDNQIFSVFTDFGTPAAGGIPARPGNSGVQGSNGGLLIGEGFTIPATVPGTGNLDNFGAVSTQFRRLESISFDQFGYFSQSIALTAAVASSATAGTTTTFTLPDTNPDYGGSVFVSDLATGLYVTVTPVSPLPTSPILVPVQGSGVLGVTTDAAGNVIPIVTDGNTTGGSNPFGGRIARILPNGVLNTFAYGFATNGAQDSSSFINSMLSISFSADGTTLFASDDQGIWQFKTTADLASSTSGTLVGLNDLRTFGVPYDGANSAVDVVDTGVDAASPPFRGRVAPGTNLFTGGLGNQDLASSTTTTAAAGGAGGAGAAGGGTTVLANTIAGHGTPVAGVIAQFVPDATLVPVNIFLPFNAGVTISASGTTGGTGGGGGGVGGGGTAGSSSLSGTSNALTSSNLLYNGLQYVVQHPFVNDPLRPAKVDRVIAASFAFGSTQTFQTEVDAFHNYPQVVIALKNAYHKFLKEGIAPIAASGEFGAPLGAGAPTTTGGTTGATGSTVPSGNNNADNASLGDVNGMSLPAVLNEVISVTGVISYPYDQNATSTPVDQINGVVPNPLGPILLFGNSLTIGGTATANTGGGGAGGGGTGGGGTGGGGGAVGGGGGGGGIGGQAVTATGFNANAQLLLAANFTQYANRIVASANRSITTDFAAPAVNVPTFRRTFSTSTTTSTTTTAGSPTDHLSFTQVGTSMSAAIVTGAYSLVSSALNYWTTLATSNGYTADAYLTDPVGVDSLNFGRHAFKNLSAWNQPSGINGILAWTAVPATDGNDGGSLSTPPVSQPSDGQHHFAGNTPFRSFASINVANAVAAIEGYVAINYLFAHHDWVYIDTNHDGLVTASEIQTFVDNSAAMGLPEAGAMAALLGGTATYSAVEPGINNTVFNENPDDPAAEQRRFNFFDYAADGQLNGAITMNELKMLSRELLPSPDAYTIVDRQRASANGFLLDPTAQRNFVALQHILPQFAWVPKSAVKKYRNISPMKFGVDQGIQPGFTFPLYTLFTPTNRAPSTPSTPQKTVVTAARSTMVGGVNVTIDWTAQVPATTASNSVVTTPPTPTTNSSPASLTPAGNLTPAPAVTTPVVTPSPTPSTPAPVTVLGTAQPNPNIAAGTMSTASDSSSTTGGTSTAPSTASGGATTSPATASSTAASASALTTSATAAIPPPEAVAPRKKVVATKSKSSSGISGFFNDIGKSLKKTFG
jgi:hypothetical protein